MLAAWLAYAEAHGLGGPVADGAAVDDRPIDRGDDHDVTAGLHPGRVERPGVPRSRRCLHRPAGRRQLSGRRGEGKRAEAERAEVRVPGHEVPVDARARVEVLAVAAAVN